MDAVTLAAAANIPLSRAEFWVHPITAAMANFGIDTRARQAAFIAQCGHETGGFTRWVEDLNYLSSERIYEVFRSRFYSVDDARPYVRSPVALANRVYANRDGNGPEASGDGFRYRGRGLIQVTFRDGYRLAGADLCIDAEGNPELLEQPVYAAFSAGAFWHRHSLNDYADGGAIDKISSIINRGSVNKRAAGASEREFAFNKAMENLA
jgi:putative chitinase